MLLINEDNITKINFVSSVIIMLLLSISLIGTFTIFEYNHLSADLEDIETNYILLQKERVKATVDNTLQRVKARILFVKNKTGNNLTKDTIAKDLISVLSSDNNNTTREYIFILQLHDINGGKEFATMLMNPNLPQFVGKKVPDSYKGAHGKAFMKEMLPKLKVDGEAFVEYWLNKPGSDKPSKKITYWKLFPEWNWIIGKGIYLDDLETILDQKKAAVLFKIKKDISFIVIISVGFVMGAIFCAYLFYRYINTMVLNYKNRQVKQQRELYRFDLILNQAHEGIVIADLNGNFTYVNKFMAKMHGYEPHEMIGRHIHILHTPEQILKQVEPMVEKVKLNGFASGEVNRLHKDGSIFPTSTSVTLLFNEKNEPDGVLGIVIDISNIVKAKQKAEEANLAKSTFLANMSHEIRTPMNGIIGMTRLALKTQLNSEQKKLLKNVQISADGLLRLLNDILDFSKIEAGQLVMESKDFSLAAMLDNIISMLTFDAEKKGLTLCMTADSKDLPAFIKGDEFRLRQILVNLIGNGIKFTKKGSVTIQVTWKHLSDNSIKLYFIVSDTGIGIPDDQQKDIFNYFSQADTSIVREFGGTGLGLAIARQLVEMMGGKIWMESTKEQGSAFHFQIVMEYGEKKNIPENKIKIQNGLKDLNVLLVEDNEINRDLAEIVLTKGQCHVITATNGKEALVLLAETNIDIVLMDIQMPVMDGLTATRIIRYFETGEVQQKAIPTDIAKKISKRLEGSHLPIVAMTANAMSGDMEQCLASGMDAYLTKPFVPEDIFAVLNRFGLKPGGGNG